VKECTYVNIKTLALVFHLGLGVDVDQDGVGGDIVVDV